MVKKPVGNSDRFGRGLGEYVVGLCTCNAVVTTIKQYMSREADQIAHKSVLCEHNRSGNSRMHDSDRSRLAVSCLCALIAWYANIRQAYCCQHVTTQKHAVQPYDHVSL